MQFFCWAKCNLLATVKNNRQDPVKKRHSKAVCSSRQQNIDRGWFSIQHNGSWKWLRIAEWGKAKIIAQTVYGWWCFGDGTGEPKPMIYIERISHSKLAIVGHKISFRYWGDCQSILVKLATWWCGCISIVEKITFATTYVCKEPLWRTNSSIKCRLSQLTRPSSRQEWTG